MEQGWESSFPALLVYQRAIGGPGSRHFQPKGMRLAHFGLPHRTIYALHVSSYTSINLADCK